MPDFPLVPFFQLPTPSLGDIANQSALTPPFAGGSIPGIGAPQGNPYDSLFQLLQQLQNSPLYQPKPESKIQQILQAIAGGVSVAASKNPGETLAQQLQARQAQKNLVTQQIQQRQNLLDQFRIQGAFQQASDISKQQGRIQELNQEDLLSQKKETRAYQRQQETEQRSLGLIDKQNRLSEESAARNRQALLDFEYNNRDFRNTLEADKAMYSRMPELDAKAEQQAILWKGLDPTTDIGIIRQVAKKWVGADKTQYSDIEKQLTNRFAQLQATAEKEMFDAKLAQEKALGTRTAAEAEATAKGERYPGSFNPFEKARQAGLGALSAKTVSERFFRNTQNPSEVIDKETWDKMDFLQKQNYRALNDTENQQYKLQRYNEILDQQKQQKQQQDQNNPNVTNATGMQPISDVQDKIFQLYNSKKYSNPELQKIISTSSYTDAEKKEGLDFLQTLTGQPMGSVPTQSQVDNTTATNIIHGLEKQIISLQSMIATSKNPNPSDIAKLNDLKQRLQYARSQHPDIK